MSDHNLKLVTADVTQIREEILPGNKTVKVEMNGNDCDFNYYGVLNGKNSDEFDIATEVTHKGLRAKSSVWIKGVLKNNAKVNLSGMIRILKGSKGSDGRFKAEFLVFDNAVAKPVPGLEIEENEVSAGHSAWVTKVSEEMIFFMMTRGLSKKQAEKAIIEGFLKI